MPISFIPAVVDRRYSVERWTLSIKRSTVSE
jgi:hypothetical protein